MQWSPSEDLIFYISNDAEQLIMHSVKFTVDGMVFSPLAPETVFTLADRKRYDNNFDISADGKRFLFVTETEGTAKRVRREPTIVLNWTKELEALVPAE